ncbi:MAG TPA: alkaline phosphatase D family protein, partial [Verrucomicrobiae bacterium]
MSNMLRSPSVGPIVGHTTTESVRVWMRGSDEAPGRTVGVAVLCDTKGKPKKDTARYFRLHREFDRTGAVDFDDLEPNTPYLVRCGSLTLDSTDDSEHIETSDLENTLPDAGAWIEELKDLPPEESTAEFTTFPPSADAGLSFIFGSCRYPGLFWAAKRADRIYGSILKRFQHGGDSPPRFVLMVGDQIYADKMNKALPIGRADTPSEFHERYVTAFTSPNMRELLRTVPTYMILDDHEIEDNWTQDRLKDEHGLFNIAMSAYMSY